MRIAITGATGLIGGALTAFLLAKGHKLAILTRGGHSFNPQISAIFWDPALGHIESDQLEGFDVVIHLAGTNVGAYWSDAYKKSIIDSRIQSTKLLCESIQKLQVKPKLLITASAIGYYGSQNPDRIVDEESPAGEGFLADVCRAWEKEADKVSQAGIRVVHLRFGVVLSKKGGALKAMWLPFQFGIGGRLGDGRQMMSWVALDEIPFIVEHIINNPGLAGAVNVVSLNAVSNAVFTRILGECLHRPTFLPVPAFMIRLLFGEMGQTLLLEGAHVRPRRLVESGYQFRFPDLQACLSKIVSD